MTRQSDERTLLQLLIEARNTSGLSLDFWADLTDGLPYKSAAILCGRCAMFPKKMYSNDKP